MLGISSDHASNMISAKEAGVINRLLKDTQSLIVTHDLYHAFNLIIQECLEKFPYKYRKIVNDIAKTFSKSPIKAAKFKAHLVKCNESDLTIKRYVDTRWTSFVDCLERILKLTSPLKTFFAVQKARKNRGVPKVEVIKKPTNKKVEKKRRIFYIRKYNNVRTPTCTAQRAHIIH